MKITRNKNAKRQKRSEPARVARSTEDAPAPVRTELAARLQLPIDLKLRTAILDRLAHRVVGHWHRRITAATSLVLGAHAGADVVSLAFSGSTCSLIKAFSCVLAPRACKPHLCLCTSFFLISFSSPN